MYPARALKSIPAVFMALSAALGAAPPTLPQRIVEDIAEVRVSTAAVAEQLRTFNELYLSKLESRMVSMAGSLSALHANTDRLLDRAHVWDTLQLHVTAWTEQMHTLSSKMDLLSRAQENLSSLETRLASLPSLDYRLETLTARLEDVDKKVETLSRGLLELRRDAPQPLEGQFVARGALATLRAIEKKVEGLHRRCGGGRGGSARGEVVEAPAGNGSGLVVRCHTTPVVMDILRDVSAKVDAIFDYSAGRHEDGMEPEDGSGDGHPNQSQDAYTDNVVPRQRLRRRGPPAAAKANASQPELESADGLSTEQTSPSTPTIPTTWVSEAPLGELCGERISKVLESLTEALKRPPTCRVAPAPAAALAVPSTPAPSPIPAPAAVAGSPSGCEELAGKGLASGVFSFQGHARYCDLDTDGGGWTVVQRRGDWGEPRLNFSRTWAEYRDGFGDPTKEFWIGNEWLHRLSQGGAALRVRLWDWEGEQAEAQYASFAVRPEADLYRLSVANYSGNATDALAAHSGQPFSTWDANHDEAPSCCPCAPAYAAGWWFYSCFEANLNGEYHTHPEENEYYRGIIWEGWRGDYSLRAAAMMIRAANSSRETQEV